MLNVSGVKSAIMTLLYSALILVAAIYACINLFLFVYQRNLLYHPVKELAGPHNYGIYEGQLVKLTTEDSIKISAWYVPPKHNEPVMVYLHGNAGNLGDRAEKLKSFVKHGLGMLAVSYRGYGDSEGSPSEKGLYNDARAAINYLKSQGINTKDTFLYGESLGSGVAIQMATEYELKAIVLEAPYTSIANRAQELYPYVPVKLLLLDKFDSLSKIGRVKEPVLIFHGYLDEVMPIIHGRRMLEAASEPKEARFYENKGHTDFDWNELADQTYRFIKGITQ